MTTMSLSELEVFKRVIPGLIYSLNKLIIARSVLGSGIEARIMAVGDKT